MNEKVEIYSIVDALEKCNVEVNAELKNLAIKPYFEREAEFGHSFEVLQKVLKIIGEGLFNAAQKVTGKEDLIFYFWPGYTTLDSKRVLIKGELDKANADGKYFTGIGFNGSLENRFYDCPSTLYFEAVLKSQINYVPPTTHDWKRQQPDDLEIKLNDESNLKILIVEKSNVTGVASNKRQVLHLKFKETEVENSVAEIAKHLSLDLENIFVKPKGKENGYIPWPLHKLYKKEDFKILNEDNLWAAQKTVYPVWLAATFCDTLYDYDKKYGNDNWLKGVKSKLNDLGFEQLTKRITEYQLTEAKLSKNKNYHKIHFSHWYSLFFDNYDTSQELGSAMFLTNDNLPEEFLFYVVHWLKFMYSQIRGLDYATMTEAKTKKEEWESIFKELNHNTKTYFSYSLRQLKKLSEANRQVMPTYENLRELKGIFNLTEYIFSIEDYLRNNELKEINLRMLLEKIIDVVKVEIEFNDGGNLKLKEKGEYLSALKSGISSEDKPLFKFSYSASDTVTTYPEVLNIVLTNLIANATRDAVNLDAFKKRTELPEVKISVENIEVDTKYFIRIEIANKAKMPDAVRDAYENNSLNDDFAHHNKLGLKITKKYLEGLNYPVSIETQENHTSFVFLIPTNTQNHE